MNLLFLIQHFQSFTICKDDQKHANNLDYALLFFFVTSSQLIIFALFNYIFTFNIFFYILELGLFDIHMFLSNQLIILFYDHLDLEQYY